MSEEQNKINQNLEELFNLEDSELAQYDGDIDVKINNPNFLTEEEVFDILYPDSGFESEPFYSEE